MRWLGIALLAVALGGCAKGVSRRPSGGDDTGPGSYDGATPDAAGLDAAPGTDAGAGTDGGSGRDSGAETDAGSGTDAGPGSTDGGSGSEDAGGEDAGAPSSCEGAADCSSCGAAGDMYCVGGSCEASPTSLLYDFESGIPTGWTSSGDADWLADASRAHGGAQSARSGDIGDDGVSTLQMMTVEVGSDAQLGFWYYTDTESGYDFLELWVDGSMVNEWSGSSSSWQRAVAPLGAGTHTIEWRYTKDLSVSSGADSVWIDDVAIELGPPVEGFEGASLPAGWSTSGDADWLVASDRAHTGSQAAENGDIGDSQTSTLTRSLTLSAAGSVSFWYYTSTESNYDYLEFWVDGTREDRWSGSNSWAEHVQSLGAGAHTLEWRYVKDGSVSSGSDTVWIDDVVAGDPPSDGNVCAP